MATRRSALTLDPTPAIAQLRLRAQFRGDDVAAYLERHPSIASILVEALDRIPRFFGDDGPVVLDVFWDPDEPEREELYALIQVGMPAEDALRRLKRFDAEWWLGAVDRANGDLTISLEIV